MKTRAYLALAAAGSLWGTGFLFGKIALTTLSVPHMIMYRLTLAACGFVPIVLMRGLAIRRHDWSTVFVAGGVGVPLLFLVQFEGLARTTVSHAALMIGPLCGSLREFCSRYDPHSGPSRAERGKRHRQPAKGLCGISSGRATWLV